MSRRREVLGYHGTSREAAAAILRGEFRPSRNAHDWLGDGVYFWEEAPRRAWDWAQRQHGAKACVVASLLVLDGCLDLNDQLWQDFLFDVYREFVRERRRSGRPLPSQRPLGGSHPLDRVVINRAVRALAREGVTIRCVRSAFLEGRRLYPWSAFTTHQHVQIAVRDPALIVTRTLLSSPDEIG